MKVHNYSAVRHLILETDHVTGPTWSVRYVAHKFADCEELNSYRSGPTYKGGVKQADGICESCFDVSGGYTTTNTKSE